MHMAIGFEKWTLDQLHRLPDDGNKYEVVRGELFVTPAPSPAHESLANALADLLDPYVRAHGLGRVSRPRAALRLEESETEPDLTVRDIPRPPPVSWAHMPVPILVVEIASRTTRRRDFVHKRSLYRDNRIPEYWIVDRQERVIRVVRPDREDVSYADTMTWHPPAAPAPLVIDVVALFHEALD